MDRIVVRDLTNINAATSAKTFSKNKTVIKIYTNATSWELKEEVAKLFNLSTRYISVKLPDGSFLDKSTHGMVMSNFNLKSGDVIIAKKLDLKEHIPSEPLSDEYGRLSEPLLKILNEWFDLYSTEDGYMTA